MPPRKPPAPSVPQDHKKNNSWFLLGGALLVAVAATGVFLWPTSEAEIHAPATSTPINLADDKWRRLNGYRVVGKQLSSSTLSLDECQAECDTRSDCAAFSWDGTKCSLKKDIVPLAYSKKTISGFKHITPSRVPSSPLYEMWGNAVWNELVGGRNVLRREALSHALTAIIQTMIGYHEPSLQSVIPQEMKDAFTAHVTTLTELQQGAGKAENTQLILLKAYIYMFVGNNKKALSTLAEAEEAATDPVQAAAAVNAKSFVLECQGKEAEADRLRVSLLQLNHAFNHSYDDYLRLQLVGYAKGRTGPKDYGSTLLKLFAFRRVWFQEIQANGPGRGAWLKHFPAANNITQGTPGVYLAGGGDLEALQKARLELFHNDFVVLRELLTPWEVKLLASYYKACLKPFYENHDSHLGRTSAYNDRVNYHLNSDFRPLMEQVFGFDVQVAYSFMCHYEYYTKDPGQPELKGHTDRQDNEWTTSIQLYSEPEGLDWPILVDKELTLPPESAWRTLPTNQDRIVKAVMPPGDAILFMGRVHNHWRPPMPRSMKEFGSVLLHYVPTQFNRFRWNNHRGSSEPYE